MKPYKPHYIVCDKAYDTEKIRTIINEEINAFNMIPNKKIMKTVYYRKNKADMFSESPSTTV